MAEQPFDRYRRVQVETASPVQLIIMMYEGIARFLNRAASFIETGEYARADTLLERSNAIVNELISTLNFEAGGEIAQNLGSIYTMTIRETLLARLRRDAKKLKSLASLYIDLRGGWVGVASKKAVS